MPLLKNDYLRFDETDVKLMQDMLKRFSDFHKGTGLPDASSSYGAYLPVFAISLLASQESVDRLSRIVVALTVVIALFTVVLAVLTFILVRVKL